MELHKMKLIKLAKLEEVGTLTGVADLNTHNHTYQRPFPELTEYLVSNSFHVMTHWLKYYSLVPCRCLIIYWSLVDDSLLYTTFRNYWKIIKFVKLPSLLSYEITQNELAKLEEVGALTEVANFKTHNHTDQRL